MYTERTLPLRVRVAGAPKVGTWLSLVERTLGVGEVASSNPVVPTNNFSTLQVGSWGPFGPTIGPDLEACFQRLLGQQIAINLLIAVLEEDRLATVPALRHVVRKAWNHDPC